MTYKDNQPTFNVNRKVVNFKDFTANVSDDKEELLKMKRQNRPNSESKQIIGNPKTKYNKVTHKLDTNLSANMVKDKIDAIENLEESKIYETHIDDDVYHNLKVSTKYTKLVDNFRDAIREFENGVSSLYDEGDNDHNASMQAVLQDALDEAQ